ncbi:MAG: hypothetical protein ACM3PS_08435 [Syntrophothermus sp.]
MSFSPRHPSQPGMTNANLEARLRQVVAILPYPETPDLAGRERQRLAGLSRTAPARRLNRLAVGLVVLFMVLAVALLVSPVRARVLDWIRIGSVRIFFTQPTATQPVPTQTPARTGTSVPRMTPTPHPTPTFLQSVLNLGGETTLAKAQEQAGFPIELPASPPDLSSPDHVYLQEMNGPVVVLVWMDPNQPEKVRMSLSEAPSDRLIFEKYAPKSVQDTQVGGHAAVWMDGEYILIMRNGDTTLTRLITQGHTLIWTTGEMTYRLETDADLETAIRIAESIQPGTNH